MTAGLVCDGNIDGDQVCIGTTTAGKALDNGTSVCLNGRGIGVVVSTAVPGSSNTKPLVKLMRY